MTETRELRRLSGVLVKLTDAVLRLREDIVDAELKRDKRALAQLKVLSKALEAWSPGGPPAPREKAPAPDAPEIN